MIEGEKLPENLTMDFFKREEKRLNVESKKKQIGQGILNKLSLMSMEISKKEMNGK